MNQINPGARALAQFVQYQRTNPYYILVSVLFATILGTLAIWLSSTISDLTRAAHTADYVSVGLRLIIAFIIFLYVMYLWLYFSRIFVYVKEDPLGETFTFILGFVVLSAVCCLPILWRYWTIILAVCTAAISIKSFLLLRTLKDTNGHPFRTKYAKAWGMYSFCYFWGLLVPGLMFIWLTPQAHNPVFAQLIANTCFACIVLLITAILVIFRFHSLEAEVKQAVAEFAATPDGTIYFTNHHD